MIDLQDLSLDELKMILLEYGGYEEIPVDIETFVDDPYYLGNYFGEDGIYPFWRKVLKEIYPSPFSHRYWLVGLRGAIGIGKTTAAAVGVLYDTYRLLCLRVPQKSFPGLLPSTKLVFAIFNSTLTLAADVVWDKISQMIASSPYFSEKMTEARAEPIPKDDKTLFPKRIDFFIGSRIGHTLGKAIYSAIIDEANFEVITDQTTKTFRSLLRRMESRFANFTTDGESVPYGTLWLISSESDKASPLNQLLSKYGKAPGVKVIRTRRWDKPGDYSGETFKVFIGSSNMDPFIIEEGDKVDVPDDLILEVPVEFRRYFEIDITEALRDIGGVEVGGPRKLFPKVSVLDKAATVPHHFSTDAIELHPKDGTRIQEFLLTPEYFKNPISPTSPRHVHIDLGLTGDLAGIGISFIRGYKTSSYRDPTTFEEITEVVPEVVVELVIGIKAYPGEQIPFWKIREFILWLSGVGYPISSVTADGFQSADMLQLMSKAGYTTRVLSVDRTPEPYFSFRVAVHEERCRIPRCKLLLEELSKLEIDPKYKKVDHPSDSSKDLADGVCGSYYYWLDPKTKETGVGYAYIPEAESPARGGVSGELRKLWGV